MGAQRHGGLAEEALTHSIIGAFYETYRQLGPGFPESIYAAALERELRQRGHRVAREVRVRVFYKGEPLAWLRLDMLVDGKVIIENKATLLPHAGAYEQLRGYLTATRLQVGLLFHYGLKPRFERLYFSRGGASPAS